ncbi:MAG: DUF1834 family protein [Candidatus Hydrogenedens sp.]|nr:DUF1834 family protein [Candidatus Hydrogenedens sp.]
MIGETEDRILARLRAAEPALGWKWGLLKGYEGELESPDALAQVLARTPAVLVHYAGGPVVEASGALLHRATFQLVFVSSRARDPRARRHGNAGDVGTYARLETALALLIGQRLGLDDLLPVEPGAIQIAWEGGVTDATQRQVNDVSILVADLETGWFVRPADALPGGWPSDLSPGHGLVFGPGDGPDGGDTARAAGDLDTVHIDWALAPGGVGPGLPDDEHAQAIDHIDL